MTALRWSSWVNGALLAPPATRVVSRIRSAPTSMRFFKPGASTVAGIPVLIGVWSSNVLRQ